MMDHLLGIGQFEVCAEWEGNCVPIYYREWCCSSAPTPCSSCVCASATFRPLSRHRLAHLDLCCYHLSLPLLFVTLRVSINDLPVGRLFKVQ